MRRVLTPPPTLTAALRRSACWCIDGAMGTMIQQHKLPRPTSAASGSPTGRATCGATTTCWSLTQPDVIRGIHPAYLDAGADIVETNTFNAHARSRWPTTACRSSPTRSTSPRPGSPARPATRRPRGRPTGRAGSPARWARRTAPASISPDVNDPGARNIDFDEMVEAYVEQARGLVDGGADLLLIETIFDTLNSKAAIFAVETLFERARPALAGDRSPARSPTRPGARCPAR